MNPVIGIDLGTTNTVVGVVQEGHAQALPDENGQRLIPSVVSFHPNGSVLVGNPAKERRLVDAANTVYSIKRLIGRSWDSDEVRTARERFPFEMREGPGQAALVVARGQAYTLPEISAFVLRRAKAIADVALGGAVEKAVITVPASFNDLQRAATKVAGRVAGIEVMRILNEPTAAALAYGFGKGTSERLAVYDFGGGTFDVTLLDLSENVFEVLATAGNTFLGGDDIDLALAELMAQELLRQHNIDARSDAQVFERLRMAAEEIKIRLSRDSEAEVEILDVAHGPGGRAVAFSFAMTREEFDTLVIPLVERTFDVCSEALGIARLTASDFDQILLVGGSTRIPLVRERVEEFFKRPVLGHISPDEVVAIGAAIQAAALTGVERRREIPAPPQPAARDAEGKKPRGTLPPGMKPPPSIEPTTTPYQGRPRMQTSPGGADPIRQTASGLGRQQQRVVVPAAGQISGPPDTAPPGTVAGLGARGRVQTGTGLGHDAEVAKARVASGRTTDAGVGEPSQIVQPRREPIKIPSVDDPTAEAGHISSFLARYASTPQKPRTQPQAQAKEPPSPKEQSVAQVLDEGDIEFDDPSRLEPESPGPLTAALRRMAAPSSTDEVTEVHRRRTGSRVSIEDEQRLPIPGIPDDDFADQTMDTATSPKGHAAGPMGTIGMPAQPPPMPVRGQVPPSLTTPTSPRPDLSPPPQAQPPGPFGLASTLISSSDRPSSPPALLAPPPPSAHRAPPPVPPAQQPPPYAPPPFAPPVAAPVAPSPAPDWGSFEPQAPAAPAPNTSFGAPSPFGAPNPFALQSPMAPAPSPVGAFGAGAFGAVAAVAQALAPVIQQKGPTAPLLVDVTPLTLTVETVQGYCDAVIARNSPVPCERSRTFATAADGQVTVRVRVAQGESKVFRENTLLGELELSGLRPAARGQVKIEVAFALDTDGILNVRAIDVATGHEARAVLRLVAMPDAQQVDAMMARQAGIPMSS